MMLSGFPETKQVQHMIFNKLTYLKIKFQF